uniref:Transcription factor HES-5 n=1 Tax=Nothoprocta perdicaria TaxID=30464 RepID=A0A8C6Z0C8_NOTPE
MAPSSSLMIYVEEKLLPKEKNKLRKPVVEKMRRDRINSSIEQLKLLLEKELQRLQPNAKLEKADVLEVTVSYLKQQSQLQQQDFNSGYLRCLKEALHFLSYHEPKKAAHTQLMKHFCQVQMGPGVLRSGAPQRLPLSPCLQAGKQPAQKRAAAPPAIWRPWSTS